MAKCAPRSAIDSDWNISHASSVPSAKLIIMKKNLAFLACGIILGVLLLVAVRFATLKSDKVHYHANFALYLNGEQDKFDGPGYYEEVQSCDAHDEDDALGRAHMHDRNNHMVHVHAHAVTWGAFFANLGYSLGDKSVETPKGVFVDGTNGNKLTLILNGEELDSVANAVIKTEDVLIINYGNEDADSLRKRINAIPRDARQANTEKDPSTCSGSQELTFGTRLKRAVGISESAD